jgi:hypothetical protein
MDIQMFVVDYKVIYMCYCVQFTCDIISQFKWFSKLNKLDPRKYGKKPNYTMKFSFNISTI